MSYQWEPIEDLPSDWADLHQQDLVLAHDQWRQEKEILREPRRLEELQERLATRWAIETGVIERLYVVERGITETLIELGLEALETFHRRWRWGGPGSRSSPGVGSLSISGS